MKKLFTALILVLLGTFTVTQALAQTTTQRDTDSFEARFEAAWTLVDQRYWNLDDRPVDWDEVYDTYRPRALGADDDAALYDVLAEMYEEIDDQHSVFVSPSRAAEIRDEYGDLPCIPALLQSGTADNPDIFDDPLLRRNDSQLIGKVRYQTVGDTVGYLRVPDLASAGMAGDIRAAVRQLGNSDALILDLRGNPGGRLVTMMQAAGIFTDGFLWRTVTNWTLPLPYPAIGATATELPLVVLIDGDVNSAAEGLAGALQARARATLVGETTAGNVEAVMPFCLRDGSQAWIATGVLAPISGPTWEGRGVVPDIETTPANALAAALTYLKQNRP